MSDVQRLICSIIKFLRSQLDGQQNELSSDACESLEVAIQCLESAYSVRQDDPSLEIPTSLLEIFRNCNIQDTVISQKEASESDKVEAERLKNEGNNLMKANSFTEALDYYSKAIALDGRNAVYYCNRGAAYLKLNNIPASIQDCKTALKIDPTYGKAYGRLGLAYTSLDDHVNARESYQKAVELEPDNEGFQNNLRLTMERLASPPTSMPVPGSPGFDIGALLNNPALMTMATQMMQYPGMQTMLNSFVTGNVVGPPTAAGGTGVEALLQAGQQLAQQMSSANPDLVEELRRQMGGPPPRPGEGEGS